VYTNGTSIVTGTATATNGGTSTLTSVTEVSGAATSAAKTGPSPSATKTPSLAAGSLTENALGAGTLLLAGVAVVFGLL
jgi:hypothetical protein